MPEIPTSLTPIAYLRSIDLEKFGIVNFFQYFNIEDVASAIPFFKDTMKNVLDFSKRDKAKAKAKNKKLVGFAKAMKANKYSVDFCLWKISKYCSKAFVI
jgi:hypothetical protein